MYIKQPISTSPDRRLFKAAAFGLLLLLTLMMCTSFFPESPLHIKQSSHYILAGMSLLVTLGAIAYFAPRRILLDDVIIHWGLEEVTRLNEGTRLFKLPGVNQDRVLVGIEPSGTSKHHDISLWHYSHDLRGFELLPKSEQTAFSRPTSTSIRSDDNEAAFQRWLNDVIQDTRRLGYTSGITA